MLSLRWELCFFPCALKCLKAKDFSINALRVICRLHRIIDIDRSKMLDDFVYDIRIVQGAISRDANNAIRTSIFRGAIIAIKHIGFASAKYFQLYFDQFLPSSVAGAINDETAKLYAGTSTPEEVCAAIQAAADAQ